MFIVRLNKLAYELYNNGLINSSRAIYKIIRKCKIEEPVIIDKIDNDGVPVLKRLTQIPEEYEVLSSILNDTILDSKSGDKLEKSATGQRVYRFYLPIWLGGPVKIGTGNNVREAWKKTGFDDDLFLTLINNNMLKWEMVEPNTHNSTNKKDIGLSLSPHIQYKERKPKK